MSNHSTSSLPGLLLPLALGAFTSAGCAADWTDDAPPCPADQKCDSINPTDSDGTGKVVFEVAGLDELPAHQALVIDGRSVEWGEEVSLSSSKTFCISIDN